MDNSAALEEYILFKYHLTSYGYRYEYACRYGCRYLYVRLFWENKYSPICFHFNHNTNTQV